MAILSKKAQSMIDKIVARYKAYLRFKSVGPQACTRAELLELVRSGMLTKEKKVESPVGEAYLHVHEQLVDNTPAPRQVRDGALDFLERMHARYTDKLTDQVASDIQSSIEGSIMPFANRRDGEAVYEALQADKDLWKQNLRGMLKDKVDNWEFRYKTIISTELNRASNWGAVDAILHNNPELEPGQITVYKQGNKPGGGACSACSHLWYMPDGTPKTYKMSELLANGTNIGRKQKDWLATIDSTHPNCSHILSELKPGFGFVNGSLEWISHGHDEYKKQKGH